MVFGLSSPNRFGAIICHRAEVITAVGKGREKFGSHETMKGKEGPHLKIISWLPGFQIQTNPPNLLTIG
jgi:hypothetical protein